MILEFFVFVVFIVMFAFALFGAFCLYDVLNGTMVWVEDDDDFPAM